MVTQNIPARKGIVLSLRKRCELLDVPRSGIYYTPVQESELNCELMQLIDRIYLQHPEYGVRRMTEVLRRKHGRIVNRKRIGRLYHVMGLRAIAPGPNTSKADKAAYTYPYFLRDLVIERKNQVWAIDITYIPMKRGFMYLCAIIDLHSRFVVGWSVGNAMSAQWVCAVVRDAVKEHGIPRVLNSDQGSQFTSDEYVHLLNDAGIQISMDGKGRALDNIFIERLWRSVKYEHVYLKPAADGMELYEGLKEYFRYYNNERMHSKLGYETPADFYEKAA